MSLEVREKILLLCCCCCCKHGIHTPRWRSSVALRTSAGEAVCIVRRYVISKTVALLVVMVSVLTAASLIGVVFESIVRLTDQQVHVVTSV